MSKKVLVVYASKYGATAEIAEKIGKALLHAGFDTDIKPQIARLISLLILQLSLEVLFIWVNGVKRQLHF